MKFLNRNIFLYLCLLGVLAGTVDYHQTQLNRLHYLLGIFYNDHFINWKDGVVYLDLKSRVDNQGLKNKAHVAYAYYQLGDQQRYKKIAQKVEGLGAQYLQRLIEQQEPINLELLPGEAR